MIWQRSAATPRNATPPKNALLAAVELRGLPVLNVCRGMQLIRCAIPLRRVAGHVTRHQTIRIVDEPTKVSSYHRFAAFESRPPLEIWTVAADGVVTAIGHSASPTTGIMWHPERNTPFATADVALFRRVFSAV
jgi:gamma-glutamyl-gamma-aminobutyrate hydrolase PuuD